ncbi:MAG: xanthine dehydrogenase family protein subunit M [Acidobacteria bacterium]|nr:xanthine dehydrogenase family protein subunit M [Acidobacteriota bacterium]
MQGFEYANPATLKEATALLGNGWGDAAVLAGGTDLLTLMKEYLMSPKRVVNIKGIKELGGISKSGAGLRIGATVTVDELMSNAAVRAEYPSLVQAGRGITSPQIRNMGTVGGDLCQRPRCWYFRNGFGLLGVKDGKSLVREGENKYHAIFTGQPALFVSASSFGPALVALGAKVKLASASGTREVDAAKFFVAPQNEGAREIALLPNEILTEIVIPAARGAKNATYEVRHKDALDWPLAAASVSLSMKGATVASARVVLGHVAPTPHAAAAAESLLAGKTITEAVADEAGKAAVADAKPLSGNAYKVQLARVAVKRALLAAAGKA